MIYTVLSAFLIVVSIHHGGPIEVFLVSPSATLTGVRKAVVGDVLSVG